MLQRGVLPKTKRLTDAEYRSIVSGCIRRASAAEGCAKLALEIGCDERTLRNARDERSTLGGATTWNLLAADIHALDALAAHFGMRLTPVDPHAAAEADLLQATLELATEHAACLTDADTPGYVDHQEERRLTNRARRVVAAWAPRIAVADRNAA